MDKRRRSRRMVELGKDVLIVLLACSALFLAARSQLKGPIRGLWQEDDPASAGAEQTVEDRVDMIRPLRLVANLPESAAGARCGIQYDSAAADELFQQVAGLLVEALSSAGTPEEVSRARWEEALCSAPGLVLDFQGQIPASVLTGWLGGGAAGPQAVVRRIAVTTWDGNVALHYRDEESGRYYRCVSEVANELQLEEALSALPENGAFYAFEQENYGGMDPDTLLSEQLPALPLYQVTNPMSGGRAALELLMEDLDISVDASRFYSAGSEQVARSGSDSLRLSERGVATYEEGGDGSWRFPVGGNTLFDRVEACRRLAAATIGARSGRARLYLISARETEEGLDVRFGYCLNGAAVQLDSGFAARFLVEGDRISRFDLYFRSYTANGETSTLLPMRQAAAAMGAMGAADRELVVVYRAGEQELVRPVWVAAGQNLTEKG